MSSRTPRAGERLDERRRHAERVVPGALEHEVRRAARIGGGAQDAPHGLADGLTVRSW
jgi:hypothetical protein